MIYIVSEERDVTTNIVLEYILSKKRKVKRINNSKDSLISFDIDNIEQPQLNINKDVINSSDIVWLRRARLNLLPKELLVEDVIITDYLSREENALNKSLEIFLKNRNNIIGSYLKEVENYKITNLLLAKQVGLKIPKTLVTSKKERAIEFFNQHKDIITKDLRYPVNLYFDKLAFVSKGTIKVKKKDLENLDDYFFPIFFQENIRKYIELRLFVFKKKVYTMAIFSQEDEQTKTDYRNFDKDNPNRLVPFQLPSDIEYKVIEFMSLANLDTGSIDIILNTDGEYIFLEVNPQGQIDWLSKSCHFYIERDIANYLMKESED